MRVIGFQLTLPSLDLPGSLASYVEHLGCRVVCDTPQISSVAPDAGRVAPACC